MLREPHGPGSACITSWSHTVCFILGHTCVYLSACLHMHVCIYGCATVCLNLPYGDLCGQVGGCWVEPPFLVFPGPREKTDFPLSAMPVCPSHAATCSPHLVPTPGSIPPWPDVPMGIGGGEGSRSIHAKSQVTPGILVQLVWGAAQTLEFLNLVQGTLPGSQIGAWTPARFCGIRGAGREARSYLENLFCESEQKVGEMMCGVGATNLARVRPRVLRLVSWDS